MWGKNKKEAVYQLTTSVYYNGAAVPHTHLQHGERLELIASFYRELEEMGDGFVATVRPVFHLGSMDATGTNRQSAPIPVPTPPPPAVCKRCGVMYEPRERWVEPEVFWNIGKSPTFKPDDRLLLSRVTPSDYCPRCEEYLQGVRDKLVKVLEPKNREKK